jgi:uncharacterized membrane protein YqjE
MYQDTNQVPLSELLSRLTAEVRQLIKTDLALVRTEMNAKVAALRTHLMLIAAGAFIMLLGIMALIAMFIIAIGNILPLWLSALIVSLILLLAGGIGAYAGIKRLSRIEWSPRQSVQILKEEGIWLKEKLA